MPCKRLRSGSNGSACLSTPSALPRTELISRVLPHLTDQDLKDIGVLLGHRRKMLGDITEMTGPSDFVRERELEALERVLVQAPSGIRVIDVVGEPGMGKSRLLHEFHRHHRRRPPRLCAVGKLFD